MSKKIPRERDFLIKPARKNEENCGFERSKTY